MEWHPRRVFNQSPRQQRYSCLSHTHADWELGEQEVLVSGDVCVSVFSGDEKMCQLYFHTAFVSGGYLSFDKVL
jgi:hypothetical protein